MELLLYLVIIGLFFVGCENPTITREGNIGGDQINMATLRTVPFPTDPTGRMPVVVDSFTSSGYNFFLIDAGVMQDMFIGNIIQPVFYNGMGELNQTMINITTELISQSTAETILNSITTTRTDGGSHTLGSKLEGGFLSAKFSVSYSHTWNWSNSHSQTGSRTFQISATEINTRAAQQGFSLTLRPGDPVGWHRIAAYSLIEVYLILVTDAFTNELITWETVLSTSPENVMFRQEFYSGGIPNFDNSLAEGVSLLDFPAYFWLDLVPEEYDVTADFSSIFTTPPQILTITHDINSIRLIGRGDYVFTTHIVIENRVNSLRMEFQNFAMQAPDGKHGISSTSNSALELRFSGVNRITGGVGENTWHGGRGGNGIYSGGTVSIHTIGQQRTIIAGGSGRAGGNNGNPGGRGGDGGHGIVANNVNLRGEFYVTGGNGGQGGTGYSRGGGLVNHGRTGGGGGNGGTAILASGQVTFSPAMRFAGIVGGIGGAGGRGGDTASTSSYGGWGGTGGRGGHGIEGNVVTLNLAAMQLSVRGGAGGAGGAAGRGIRAAGQRGRTGATGGNGGNAVYYTSSSVNDFSERLFVGGAGGAGGAGGPMGGGANTGFTGNWGQVGGTIVRRT